MRPLKKSIVLAMSFAPLGGFGSVSVALADLTICNKTQQPVGVALAHRDNKMWTSNGWWTVEPGLCSTLVEGALTEDNYFLHAVHYKVGGSWQGAETFCTGRGAFKIAGRLDCEERGYQTSGFLEIKSDGAAHWQHDLTTRAVTSAQ